MNKKIIIIGILIVLLAIFAAGCIGQPAPPVPRPEGRIVIGGSTTVFVVAVPLAERFMERHPGVVIESHSVGSTAGIVGAREGTFDIGMSSRLLRGAELGWGLREFIICHDASAPIVHPTNPVRNLTMGQLREIFTGNITNWREVGGRDLRITVIIREEGSGARATFEDLVHRGIRPVPTLILVGTGGVRAGVAGDPSAISYVTLAAVDPTVRALNVDGIEPTAKNVLAGHYRIVYPFRFMTLGEPSPLEQRFIDFVLGPEGQQMLADEGMVRVN